MKKLLMVVTMCLAFCAVAVNAEANRKWEKIPDQQKVTDDGRNEIPVSIDGDKITVTLPQGWTFWFEKDRQTHSPLKVNDEDLTTHQQREKNKGENNRRRNTSPRVLVYGESESNLQLGSIYNDNQGGAGLPVTVTVAPPSGNDDKLSIIFKGDDGFFAGSVTFGDSQAIAEAKQKAEDEKMEDMYLEYVNYDNSKTWYQRLGDGIRDQWWNFTGMFY